MASAAETAVPAAAIPGNVDPALVVDFDYFATTAMPRPAASTAG